MPEDTPDRAKPRILYPPSSRDRRRELPALLGYSLIASTGMALATVCFYLLRWLGY